ncbi:MAG TPA: hypothetical protein VEX67_12650 [Solirubrobacteraceae bacterium]|nr:hypothetical protein [Solirubrobacteraceae bacterium]
MRRRPDRALLLLLPPLLLFVVSGAARVDAAGKLLALRAARVSEFVADRAAADWGYADQLTSLFTSFGEPPPRGLIARLSAEHPLMQQRIDRLAGL